ncbi:MAG: hypothetical protein HY814_08870 [Candidatus Riflebacteria bacterium]|nr:hypothetical protein [Candidatus Riflebacteria bacterium]
MLVPGPALAYELEAGFRWAENGSSGDVQDVLIRAGSELPERLAPGFQRVRLGSVVPKGPLPISVVARYGPSSDRGGRTITVYRGLLELGAGGAGQTVLPIRTNLEGRVELVLMVDHPGWKPLKLDVDKLRRVSEGVLPSALEVHGGAMPARVAGRSSNSRVPSRCKAENLPPTESGLAGFGAIRLHEVDLSRLPAGSFEALVLWVHRGGALELDLATFRSAAGTPRLAELWPPTTDFEESDDADALAPPFSILTRRLGRGHVTAQVASAPLGRVDWSWSRRPMQAAAGAGDCPRGVQPRHANVLEERVTAFAGWVLLYLAALGCSGLWLRRRGIDMTLRILPLVPVGCCLLYGAVCALRQADVEVASLRLVFGTAGSEPRIARVYTSAYSPVAQEWRFSMPSASSVPPIDTALAGGGYLSEDAILRPFVLDRGETGWSARLELMPAELRAVAHEEAVQAAGTVSGSLEADLTGRRWTGELVSNLPFRAEKVHVFLGPHHQAFGPLEPGQSVKVSMPFVLSQSEPCHPECLGSHDNDERHCPSCNRFHPLSTALYNFIDQWDEAYRWTRDCLVAEYERSRSSFVGPFLVAIGPEKAVKTARQSCRGRDVDVLALPVTPLQGAVTLPPEAAIPRFELSTSQEYVYRRRTQPENSWRFSCYLNSRQRLELQFPYRGPLRSLEVRPATGRGNTEPKRCEFSLHNLRSGTTEEATCSAREAFVVTSNAADYFDRRDGTIAVALPDSSSSTWWPQITLEGAGR